MLKEGLSSYFCLEFLLKTLTYSWTDVIIPLLPVFGQFVEQTNWQERVCEESDSVGQATRVLYCALSKSYAALFWDTTQRNVCVWLCGTTWLWQKLGDGCNHAICHIYFPTVQTRTAVMSPYICKYCMWQPAICLWGSAYMCMCLYFCMQAPLSLRHWGGQTDQWPCRNRDSLSPVSPGPRAHTIGETNKLE